MNNYNPFISAFNDLTSEQAIYHYQKTAWAHAQRSIDDSIIAITYTVATVAMIAQFAYDLGAAFGEGHYSAVCTHTKAAQTCLPEPRAIALLAPSPGSKTKTNPLSKFTKAQLIAMAKKRGLRATRTMAKPALINLLMECPN